MDALRFGSIAGTIAGLAAAAGIVWLRSPEVVTFVEPMPVMSTVTVHEPVIVPAPPAPPAPTVDALGCPELPGDDEPIGVAVDADAVDASSEGEEPQIAQVVAAAHVPELAMRTVAGKVMVSDDDGTTFHAALTDRTVDEIRIDAEGTLFARAGVELAVLSPGARRASWRTVELPACYDCRDEIGVVGDRLMWIRGTQIATSRDRGRTWKPAPDDMPWTAGTGTLRTWHGALYQLEHYEDECGLDESPTFRFDPDSNTVESTIFDNEPTIGAVVLRADSDVTPTWRWQRLCRQDDPQDLGPCHEPQHASFSLLLAKELRPVEGARTLSVYSGALVELCRGGAREIYRAFPLQAIDAVDSHGRPLVARSHGVYRWSPTHGWRQLLRVAG
jgi:hypothetical protein